VNPLLAGGGSGSTVDGAGFSLARSTVSLFVGLPPGEARLRRRMSCRFTALLLSADLADDLAPVVFDRRPLELLDSVAEAGNEGCDRGTDGPSVAVLDLQCDP
jgi:hypothetical protein